MPWQAFLHIPQRAHGTAMSVACFSGMGHISGRKIMASAPHPQKNEQLKPDDFPLHVDDSKITRQDGKPIAKTDSEDMAKEIAERLNCEEQHREEDKWSA
jgi:hypothetical protein